MIEIKEKKNCCGCTACAEICPQKCIVMKEDNEGFLYPTVDASICVNCGLCEKVCPVLKQSEEKLPLKVYAAINPDEKVRKESSSGGVFSLLAQKVIKDGGVVFGARFNEDWEVVHDYCETLDGLSFFQGSKYVQSSIGNCYRKAEMFLKEGRTVLFSGTSCQIAGLKRFLRKNYENLLTVDVVCHGVPSPLVWREYLRSLVPDTQKIGMVSFRKKTSGWKKYDFFVNTEQSILQKACENLYMRGFLSDIYLRLSCYSCPAKSGKSGSDITLADFWGVDNYHPVMDDGKGTSLVLLNTDKGLDLFEVLGCNVCEATYEEALAGNPSIVSSVAIPSQRNYFFKKFGRGERCENIIEKTLNKMKPSFYKKCIFNIKKYLKYIS